MTRHNQGRRRECGSAMSGLKCAEVCHAFSVSLFPLREHRASLLRARRPTRIAAVAADPPRDEGATLQPSSAATVSLSVPPLAPSIQLFFPMFCYVTSPPS